MINDGDLIRLYTVCW